MKTFFIERAEKVGGIRGILKIVTQRGNKIIINAKMDKIKFKTKIKISKKIIQILSKEKSRQIVLERGLKQDKELVNLLYSYNINICDSKWLFRQLTNEVIEIILKDKSKQESEIWICVNEIDSLIEEYIYKFAKEFKRITIVTNHIEKFKKIENKLYEEDGILINVTNNRRKSLIKANLILNVDFPKEILNQFAIYDNAVIINLEGDMKINKKRFCGKIINDIEFIFDQENEVIDFCNKNALEKYDLKDICQVIEIIPKGEILLN